MIKKDFKVLKKLNPVWLPCTISGVRNKSKRVMINGRASDTVHID